MNRTERKDKTGKNAGFSLVEILVAVVILAIIVVPLLHGFISSARTNAKAREVIQATTAGQNVMEELKNIPLKQLFEEKDKITSREYTMESGDPPNVTTKKYVTYEYNYGTVRVDGTEYDTLVTLDPSNYFPGEITEYNKKELAEIYDISEVYDACYIQDKDLDEQMAALFAGYDTEKVKQEMERNIVVDISEKGGKQAVYVTLQYTYAGKTKYVSPQKQCIYSNDSTSVKLRNVYLFFQPMYNGTQTQVREQINVRNLNNLPVNVYLVKQNRSSAGTEAENQAKELQYRVDVNVLEKDRADSSYFDAGDELKVLTALRSNLTDAQLSLKYGVTETSYQTQKKIMLNGAEKQITAVELLDFKDLSAPSAGEHIYKIQVSIYRKGGRNRGEVPLVSLQGTKEE